MTIEFRQVFVAKTEQLGGCQIHLIVVVGIEEELAQLTLRLSLAIYPCYIH